jgi:hypothetical protein
MNLKIQFSIILISAVVLSIRGQCPYEKGLLNFFELKYPDF